jgi:SAM-dependent methyltransferase
MKELPMEANSVRERIDREREHWDAVTTEDLYDGWVEKPYDEWRDGAVLKQATDFLGPLGGKRILVCSEGKEVIPFARQGAEVWCFDISQVRLNILQELVNRHGLQDRVHLQAMPFESLEYEDDFFDLAFGWAVVHHVDLERSGAELRRVLRPGGRASFIEPLGVNPVLQFVREHVPYRHKSRTVDEAPFTYREIRQFGAQFERLHFRETTLLGALHWRVFQSDWMGELLYGADRYLLKIPFLRPLCSVVWIGVEA